MTTPASVPDSGVSWGISAICEAGATLTINVAANCLDMDWTGATNTPTLGATDFPINAYGSVIFIAGMTITWLGNLNFWGIGAGLQLTTAGKTLWGVINRSTGTLTLQDNLTCTSSVCVVAGVFITNNRTVTCNLFSDVASATVKTVTLGNSTINCAAWSFTGAGALTLTANTSTINVSGTGAFAGGSALTYNVVNLNGTAHTVSGANTIATLNLGSAVITSTGWTQTVTTLIAGTSTIQVSGTGAFAGGGHTYNKVELNGTAHTISGDNVFARLTLAPASTQTITFTDGSTQTIAIARLSGSAGHVHTLQGSGAAGWTIACTNPYSFDYISVSRSTITGNIFYAPAGTDGANNVNWLFSDKSLNRLNHRKFNMSNAM